MFWDDQYQINVTKGNNDTTAAAAETSLEMAIAAVTIDVPATSKLMSDPTSFRVSEPLCKIRPGLSTVLESPMI